ncbi:MAG: TetR family transcriptional regulator [Acidimicrobiia bacterium]
MTQGLRERKKAETRDALASAALRLADELGPDRVTIDNIATAAGVSPRTFFNYFASKEDAIVGSSESSTARVVDALVARPAREAPIDALRAAVHASADHLQADPDDWLIRHRLVGRYPALGVRYAARLAAVEHELVLEIARRTKLDADVDTYPAVMVSAALAASRVALTVWQERDRRGSLPALFDEVFDQLASGFTLVSRRSARRGRAVTVPKR